MDRIVTINMNQIEAGDVWGKVVNVYDSYANALAHGATGLVTVNEVNRLTGAVGDAITQTAKTAGPEVDLNGMLVFAADEVLGHVWLNCAAGRFGGPLRVDLVSGGANSSSGE